MVEVPSDRDRTGKEWLASGHRLNAILATGNRIRNKVVPESFRPDWLLPATKPLLEIHPLGKEFVQPHRARGRKRYLPSSVATEGRDELEKLRRRFRI